MFNVIIFLYIRDHCRKIFFKKKHTRRYVPEAITFTLFSEIICAFHENSVYVSNLVLYYKCQTGKIKGKVEFLDAF